MDSTEYKIIKNDYSEEDLKKIEEFNNSHIQMAKSLLNYNKLEIINNKEYSELSIIDRIKYIQKKDEFSLFCKTYPVVSKYIIAFGLFSTKAFTKYINWKSNIRPSDSYRVELVSNPRKQELWKNKYIYSVYVKYLFKEKNPHCNLNEINKMYIESVESLNEETNKFFDLYEKEVEKLEITKHQYTEERKQKIKEQLQQKMKHWT